MRNICKRPYINFRSSLFNIDTHMFCELLPIFRYLYSFRGLKRLSDCRLSSKTLVYRKRYKYWNVGSISTNFNVFSSSHLKERLLIIKLWSDQIVNREVVWCYTINVLFFSFNLFNITKYIFVSKTKIIYCYSLKLPKHSQSKPSNWNYYNKFVICNPTSRQTELCFWIRWIRICHQRKKKVKNIKKRIIGSYLATLLHQIKLYEFF